MQPTPKDFEFFKKQCKWWIRYFGLSSWSVLFEFADCDDADADCSTDSINKQAVIRLNSAEVSNEEDVIALTAFHEICELLFGEFDDFAKERYTTADQLNSARHNIIHILENTLFREKQLVKKEVLKKQKEKRS